MLKLSVYLFHHTSFFAVCSTNSVTLGRKSVARKKKIDSGENSSTVVCYIWNQRVPNYHHTCLVSISRVLDLLSYIQKAKDPKRETFVFIPLALGDHSLHGDKLSNSRQKSRRTKCHKMAEQKRSSFSYI